MNSFLQASVKSPVVKILLSIPEIRDAAEAILQLIDLNGGFNLIKLASGFHWNHPKYSDYVREKLGEIQRAGLSPGSIQTLQNDLRNMIDAAYDNYKMTGQNLNDYFRQFNNN